MPGCRYRVEKRRARCRWRVRRRLKRGGAQFERRRGGGAGEERTEAGGQEGRTEGRRRGKDTAKLGEQRQLRERRHSDLGLPGQNEGPRAAPGVQHPASTVPAETGSAESSGCLHGVGAASRARLLRRLRRWREVGRRRDPARGPLRGVAVRSRARRRIGGAAGGEGGQDVHAAPVVPVASHVEGSVPLGVGLAWVGAKHHDQRHNRVVADLRREVQRGGPAHALDARQACGRHVLHRLAQARRLQRDERGHLLQSQGQAPGLVRGLRLLVGTSSPCPGGLERPPQQRRLGRPGALQVQFLALLALARRRGAGPEVARGHLLQRPDAAPVLLLPGDL
mmetsp:Transcript_29382/g.78120  ORF Transcript_29382/g.78120 Transcript_29382/m.78120 type:complete len:337 (+) Transcript_29382:75-1085(+)